MVLAGVAAGLFRRLPETGHLDPQPAAYWGDPQVAFEPEPDTGPVLVAVHFTVAPERQSAFLTAMDQLRQAGIEDIGLVVDPKRNVGGATGGQ